MATPKINSLVVAKSIEKQAAPLTRKLKQFATIRTKEEYEQAGIALKALKSLDKLAKTEEDGFYRPLKELTDKVRAHFKPFHNMVAEQELATKDAMLKYLDKAEVKSAKLESQFEQGSIRKLSTLASKQEELTASGPARVRELEWLEAVDESLTPRAYMIPDRAAILDALHAGKKVAGWKLSTKKSISI